MPDFGHSFKSARESKDWTLEKVAQETRIATRFLRAIESETFHLLPGGVFNRGFIRTYAERLGLDPDLKLSEYAALTSDLGTPEFELIGRPPVGSGSDRHVFPIAVALLIAGILVYYVTLQGSGFENDATTGTAPAVETTATLARPSANNARQSVTPTPTPVANSGRVASREAAGHEIESTEADRRRTAEPVDEPEPAVNVQLDVHDPTWISLLSDGRQVVEGATLVPGTHRTYSAMEALELTIGNAAGLTLLINGEEVRNLGREGEVRVLRITPGNFRRFTGG